MAAAQTRQFPVARAAAGATAAAPSVIAVRLSGKVMAALHAPKGSIANGSRSGALRGRT